MCSHLIVGYVFAEADEVLQGDEAIVLSVKVLEALSCIDESRQPTSKRGVSDMEHTGLHRRPFVRLESDDRGGWPLKRLG